MTKFNPKITPGPWKVFNHAFREVSDYKEIDTQYSYTVSSIGPLRAVCYGGDPEIKLVDKRRIGCEMYSGELPEISGDMLAISKVPELLEVYNHARNLVNSNPGKHKNLERAVKGLEDG